MKTSIKYQNLSEEYSDTNEDDPGQRKSKKFSWKSFVKWTFIGYMVGLLTTILWFTIFSNALTYIRSQSTRKILYILLIYACILLCSRNARCISILILPILFSSKGRSALIATALVLAATGPTANILRNVDVLVESISCGQQQLKEALERMLEVVKRPLVAVKNAIDTAMVEMKKVLETLQLVLVKIQKLILQILDSIKKAFDWLANVVSVCNKEMGTPFDRCLRVSESAMEDCKKKMGNLAFLCNVTDVLRALCYSVKFIDALCVLVDFVSDSIIATVTERLDRFKEDIKTMFYVSVKFDHDFSFKTVATKNLTEVGSDIVAEIQKELNGIFFLFGWVELVGGLMIFFLVIKALLYKSKYLSSDRFDNHFITSDFVAIDMQRRKMGKDAVLPLTRKERGKYVKISSCSLVRAEMHKISRTILFIIVPTVQLLCICLTDYSLFWLLATINHFGQQEAGLEIPPFLSVNVSGSGLTADIFRGIVHAFEPLGEKYEIDPRPCLPVPYPPTYAKYWEIGGLMGLAWVFLFCQPYGLRCRQVVMGVFYPSRSKERALWLYNNILWNRDSFMKFARRQARSRILKDKTAEAYSLTSWVNSKLSRYWFFRAVFRVHVPQACNICATPLKGGEDMVKCQQQGCRGMYCAECYAELNNMCCLCSKPIDYGDLSDVSEEKDSSDEMDGVQIS